MSKGNYYHLGKTTFVQTVNSFDVPSSYSMVNQSAENAGVAFVKGTHERNEFFEKKKVIIYDEQARRTRQRINSLRDELI